MENKSGILQQPLIKKRKPILAAFLSFISLGLGQIYNGELFKGITLKVIMCIIVSLYALRIYFEGSIDLLFLLFFLLSFLSLKIYSMGQAFINSRKLDASYTLRKFNKFYFYTIFTIIFFLLPTALSQVIRQQAIMKMSEYHPFRSAKAKDIYLNLYDTRAKKWPVTSESRMVDTSYGKTFVQISGLDNASPLVLLHGVGGNSLQWMPNIKALSERYKTYVIDNIYDNGRSIYTRISKNPDDLVNWLDELFSALKLENNINLVGLSYGGWLTSQYALRFPNRLNKIVLLAPVCTVLPLSLEWIKRAVLCALPHRYFIKNFMYWFLEDFARKDEVSRMMLEEEVDFAYISIRCFKPKRTVNPTVLTDMELQSIKVPILFLVGENEKIYSAQKAIQRINKVAPHIRTEVIPNAGHDLTIVQTEMVNRKILEFLK